MGDTNNCAGRIATIEDASGWQKFSYGKMGEVTKNIRTFALPYENKTYIFAMEYEYDRRKDLPTMQNSFNKAIIPLIIAIIIIASGGLCTFFTASTVYVHLREGENSTATNTSFSEDLKDTLSSTTYPLPFTIRLEQFSITYYEGTRNPKDYISQVTIFDNGPPCTGRISMNKILRHKGYRIFQEDYDKDLHGSVLLIRYDPWGTALVYAGFLLLTLSMMGLLIRRDGAFRRLLRALCFAPLFLLLPNTYAQNVNQESEVRKQRTGESQMTKHNLTTETCQPSTFNCRLINTEEAKAFGQLSVYYNGRIAPFDSYARDYCKTVFPKSTYPAEYTPVQLVIDIYWFPEKWPDKPCPVMRLFPQQNLWLSPEEDLSSAQFSDTLFIAHILDWLKQSVQEENHQQNILIINSISKFQEKRCTSGCIHRQQERTEILYNQFKPERKIFLVEMLMSILLFILLLTTPESLSVKRWAQPFIITGLTLTLADIGLRCYISGHNPFSGTFDTLLLVSAGILLIGTVASTKNTFIALPSLITSAFITLAATLMGGQSFSPLMPVLISPWLMVHVAIIMTSYCFFTLTFVLAIISIFLLVFQKEKYIKLKIKTLSQIFCILGVVFLSLGIMVGAAWANISWGQYWSWDPKETWALITLIGYSIALPGVIPAANRHETVYHLIVIIAFGLLLMTYFGMSLFGGMHTY